MNADMAHIYIYNKFIGPLPSTAEDYVSSIQKFFPSIIDTKILLNANGVFRQSVNKSNTSLSRAFVSICPQIALGVKTSGLADRPCVEVEVRVDEKRVTTNPTLFLVLNQCDATVLLYYMLTISICLAVSRHLILIYIFYAYLSFSPVGILHACNHLGIDFTLHVLAGDLAKETKLQNYIYRLYLSWVSGDVIYLTSEIRACIAKAFGPNYISAVYHLDESAVYIQFTKPELVSKFLEMKETLSRISDPISVLHPLPNILNGEYTHHAATYNVYQQICSPSTSKKLFADQAEAVGIKHKTVSSRAEGEKKGNQVFDKENEVRMFDEKVDDQMSPSHGYSETDRSTDSFYLDEVLASK
ncbi:hypothetical protein KY290_010526 [Solanum tuberosum]|uniref:Uncharacterized protein n=1 Tax=Solanum tuberosum TaxID=4113 RepID=A0ABQ7VY46_SOLTU|nr:hypothetical protein KY290_010526 [Solanum tuberosum]